MSKKFILKVFAKLINVNFNEHQVVVLTCSEPFPPIYICFLVNLLTWNTEWLYCVKKIHLISSYSYSSPKVTRPCESPTGMHEEHMNNHATPIALECKKKFHKYERLVSKFLSNF